MSFQDYPLRSLLRSIIDGGSPPGALPANASPSLLDSFIPGGLAGPPPLPPAVDAGPFPPNITGGMLLAIPVPPSGPSAALLGPNLASQSILQQDAQAGGAPFLQNPAPGGGQSPALPGMRAPENVDNWQNGVPEIAIARPALSANDLAGVINTALAGSPMQGLGDAFVKYGQQRNLDPRFMAAIASPESSFGRNLKIGAYNAFGVKYSGDNSSYPSWDAAINAEGKTLDDLRGANNSASTATIYPGHYCQDNTCVWGLNLLNQRMKEMGADPNALGHPYPPGK